jgi:hypothetical protein
MRISRPASQSNTTRYFVMWSYNNLTYNTMTDFAGIGPSQRFARMYRHYDIVNQVNATETLIGTAPVLIDDTTSTFATGVYSINWTQDVYLGIALTQGVNDSSTIESVVIQIFRP